MTIYEKNRYKAYSILRKYLSFKNDEENLELKIEEFIQSKIKNISGKFLLNKVLEKLPKEGYSKKFDRIPFTRIYDYKNENINLFPYGYLINLSYINYYNTSCILLDVSKEIDEIMELSIALYYIKDIKRFFYPINLFITTSSQTFAEDIKKDIENTYFGLFPQSSIEFTSFLIEEGLKDYFSEKGLSKELKFIESLLNIIKNKKQILNIVFLKNELKNLVKKFEVDNFLEKLSFTKEKVEERFELNHLNYLFIQEEEKFIIPILPMNIIALYKQSYVLLTEKIDKFSIKFGEKLEKILENLIIERGIVHKKGYWEKDNTWYESDLILEFDKMIVIIELKKGNLHYNTKKGEIFQALLDVKKTLLDSQIQALRLRSFLEENKRIRFFKKKDKNSKYQELIVNDRRIMTLSLSLEDYDSLHCKSISSNIIKEGLFIEKVRVIPSYPKEEIQINKYFNELKEIHQILESSSYSRKKDIDSLYHYSLFLNLQYFYYLLKDKEIDLEDKLSELCCIIRSEDIFQN